MANSEEIRHNLKERSPVITGIILLLITLLAFGLRFYRLDAQSLWYDEGFSVLLARADLVEIAERTAADIQPPLYYYLLHDWMGILGDGEGALRGLSLLFGVLTVPLIYALAWQLFHSRLAGLLAALLLAVSPLHVWYGQEVRMYTMLTFLCLLSSYFLLLVVNPKKGWQTVALWVGFTLANIAAIYTHYFAFFVLAFQGLYLVVVFVGSRRASTGESGLESMLLILGGLVSGIVTMLAYLPWLPYLSSRYGQDASYWPGQLKLPEVILDIVLSFVGGESIREQVGAVLALGYIFVFIVCLLALIFHAARTAYQPLPMRQSPRVDRQSLLPGSYYPLLFVLLYLFLPPSLILALSYNSPKFNARYVMVSHPAFLLILAGGLAALWERRAGILGNVLRGTVSVLALLFLLVVSAYANLNAYTDPAFARADFRGVVDYIQKHSAPDETIILTSGHMFPVFDYYAPGTERRLLPDSPTLDTTQILDYSIAAELNAWLAGRSGVWVVLWQDEVVDPTGFLTTMLAEVGEEQPVDEIFPQIDLRYYRLPEDAGFSEQPTIDHPTNYNFGGKLLLLGYAQTGERQVTLYWEALQPLDEDYRVSIVLRDTLGQSWGQWDGRPSAYYYPTDRWSAGEVVFGRHDLALLPGAPPGDYGLEVGVYTEEDPIGLDLLDPAGAPQGKRAMLGAVRLAVPATEPDQVEAPNPGRIDLGGGLALLGWELGREEAQPGDRLLLELIWSVESQPQDDYRVRLLVTDEAGQALNAGTFPPTNIWHPTSIWLPGQAWRGQNTFRLPIQTQPGEARLAVQLVDMDGASVGQPADLTTIQVLPTSRVFVAPQPEAPRQATFSGKIVLWGADLAPTIVDPGGVVRMTLYWQAVTEMDIPYTVFVHLLGPDGHVVAGHDSEPAGGMRPTTGWVPGEFIADPHEIPVPSILEPADYVIEVGLYDAGAPDMPRLPIIGDEGQTVVDRVIFGPIQVR